MKLVALGLLALVVLATAKSVSKKSKIISRQKRQDDSFDGLGDLFGSLGGTEGFNFGSFDFTGLIQDGTAGSSADLEGLSSLAGQVGERMSSMMANINPDALLEQFGQGSEMNGEALLQQLGTSFSNMMSNMANTVPDPLTDPSGFAAYAELMESQLSELGGVGDAFINDMFESKIEKGLSDLGISSFTDGEVDALEFFDQMDTGAWSAMSKLNQNKDMFDISTMNSDDFFGMLSLAGEDMSFMDSIIGMREDSSSVTADFIANAPPEMFAIMDPSVLSTAVSNFTTEQKEALCSTMENTDPETAEYLMEKVDCLDYFANLAEGIDPEYEMALLESLQNAKPMDQWLDADWDKAMQFTAGFEPEFFDQMSDDYLKNNIGTLANHVYDMEEDDMFSLMDNMEAAFGDFSQIPASSFEQMGPMLAYIDPMDFYLIPSETKLAALDNFIGIELDDEFAAIMAEEVLDLMPSFDQWTSSEFEKCIDFIKYDEEAIDLISIDTIIASLPNLTSLQFDEEQSLSIVERILEREEYASGNTWTVQMVMNMGPLLVGVPVEILQAIPLEAFDAGLEAMNGSLRDRLDFPYESARAIVDNQIASATQQGRNLTKYAPFMKALTYDELKAQNASLLPVILEAAKKNYDDMEESSRRGIVELIKSSSAGLRGNLDKIGAFFRDLSLDEIDELPFDLLNPKSPSKTPLSLDPTPSQTRRAWENIVSMVGLPSKASGNWSVKFWKSLGPIACGVPCSELKKLALGKKFPSILETISKLQKAEGCLADTQMRCLAQRVREYYFRNGTTDLNYARVTKTNIKKTALFMSFFNATDLYYFNQSLCMHIVSNIGKFELSNVPRANLVGLKNFVMNCSGKASTQDPITPTELRSVGDIQCGIELQDIPRVSKTVLLNYFSEMIERCQLPVDVEDALLDAALQANNVTTTKFNITEKELMKLGPAVTSLNETMLNKVPQLVMFKAIPRIKKAIARSDAKDKKREENGLGTDLALADLETKEARKGVFFIFAKDAIVAKRDAAAASSTSAPAGRRRRRRSTTFTFSSTTGYTSLTCADMKKMGSGVTSIAAHDLNMTSATFTSCMSFFGTQTGWSHSQKYMLWYLAYTAYGEPSTMTTSQLLTLGTVAQGFPDSKLSSITYTNDIVASFGKYTGWNTTQLSAIFGKWLTDTQSGSVTNIDSTELSSLGDVACGATTAQISAISPAIYRGASSKIGSLLICTEGQLQAYAGLATNAAAYGATTTWDAATVASVGTVIGGLSPAEIGNLTSAQIEAISAATIASMPATAFSGFTSSQLLSMSTTQTRSITSEQADALSASAKATLLSSTDYIVTTSAPTSGATNLTGGLAVAMAILLRALM